VARCRPAEYRCRHVRHLFRSHRATAKRPLARQGIRREGPADRTRDPVPEDLQDRMRRAGRAKESCRRWPEPGGNPTLTPPVPGRLVAFVCAHGGLQRPGILMGIAGTVISGARCASYRLARTSALATRVSRDDGPWLGWSACRACCSGVGLLCTCQARQPSLSTSSSENSFATRPGHWES
jgi:hypothetical protein